MVELLAAAARLGAELPASVAREIAESGDAEAYLRGLSPASRREPLLELFRRWKGLSVADFGAALLAAALTAEQHRKEQCIELVWTGPDSHVIPVRQTEQVLLDLIRCARKRLLVVSYAVYHIQKIREALLDVIARGVRVQMIVDVMEPGNIGGYNSLIAIGEPLLSSAEILYWPKEQRAPDVDGRRGTLHVKCVVADGERMFISSANLTEQAFRLNMELGVFIAGTRYARDVEEHFAELVAREILLPLP